MILDFLLCALATSAAIFGFHFCTTPGFILDFMHRLPVPDALAKPIYACPMCMSSLWGTSSFVFLAWIGWLPLHVERWAWPVEWALFVLGLVSFNFLFATARELYNYFGDLNDQ